MEFQRLCLSSGLNWAMGEGVTFNGTPIVAAEVGLALAVAF